MIIVLSCSFFVFLTYSFFLALFCVYFLFFFFFFFLFLVLFCFFVFFFFNDTATTEIYTNLNTLSLHDALPIFDQGTTRRRKNKNKDKKNPLRSEETRLNSSHEFVSRMPSSA
eukprot:TRINITY_DN68213_c1_g1_i1.p3 TRINITY_DN68213_c1_g1~~TRINITY_DN68213_c1_g1_i1.p3  ORF type:complete len:113 (-),score=9.09 TRINITY_DN68213_c1_g1_i1:27-365(-)